MEQEKKSETIVIVIPTFNEAANIEELTKNILDLNLRIQILFVDDNSPDGTGDIADTLSKKHKNKVFVLHRKGKLGLGSAYIDGFKYALKNLNSDLIFSMDADFSHDPKYLPNFVNKINQGYDIVIGSRYIKGGGVSWPLQRRIISKCANLFARTILWLRISDVTGAFRCYKSNVLSTIDLNKISSDGFSFLQEILFLCKKERFRFGETPIFFVDRQKGKSKLSKKEIVNFLLTLLRLRFMG